MGVHVNPAGELCCPLCGGSNTHIDEACMQGRADPDIRTVEPSVTAGVCFDRLSVVALFSWCESCGGKFQLRFTPGKGVTLVESIDLDCKIDGWLDPEPTPSIKPIETSYAGCRFRSRLEARWAVFFDQADIKWQYEPQGYQVGPDNDRRPYLPDFWLPDPGVWVEVKGRVTPREQRTLFYAATPGSGLPNVDYGLLLLGEVPHVKPGWWVVHPVLRRCESDLCGGPGPSLHRCFARFSGSPARLTVGNPIGHRGHIADPDEPNPVAWDLQATVVDDRLVADGWGEAAATERVAQAYTAARSARFEHGEKGPR